MIPFPHKLRIVVDGRFETSELIDWTGPLNKGDGLCVVPGWVFVVSSMTHVVAPFVAGEHYTLVYVKSGLKDTTCFDNDFWREHRP